MEFEISVKLHYEVKQSCELLLQIEAAPTSDQKIVSQNISFDANPSFNRIAAEEEIGERIWLTANESFECDYNAKVRVERQLSDLASLQKSNLNSLPADVVKYLMASRYCFLDPFQDFIEEQFAGLTGGAFVQAASDWIKANFTYANDASDVYTTAYDSFLAQKGVCRDYAHVLIALARGVAIPARIVSAYGPDVDPQDFHAVVEVYLEGQWHLIDPTGIARANEIIRIGVGRDATDIAFITSYGWLDFKSQSVHVRRVQNN